MRLKRHNYSQPWRKIFDAEDIVKDYDTDEISWPNTNMEVELERLGLIQIDRTIDETNFRASTQEILK